MKRILAILLTASMAIGLASCGGNPTTSSQLSSDASKAESGNSSSSQSSEPAEPAQKDKTLVIGVAGTFEEKWNPFLAESAYDMQVIDQVFVKVTRENDKNEMIPWGGDISYVQNDDGTVVYTVKVNEGMKFSDGEPVTIDDYIYGLYVLSDPSYTGPSTILADDIKGLKEYYYDDENYEAKQAEIEKKIAEYKPTDEEIKASAEQLAKENEMDVADFMPDGDYYADYNLAPKVAAYKAKLLSENVSTGGGNVKEISGIQKVDEYTCTVTFNSINIYGDRDINYYLIPSHYYGEITKGDVSKILQNREPVGSGPYIWQGYGDNIVTCTANTAHFLGVPTIGTVKWQYVPESDTITALAAGDIDIAEPTGSKDNVAELEAQGIQFDLTDNAGYGYMGLNCENLSLNVRKGIFSLMNRVPSVEGYYGPDIAQVIERPMTTVLAEYPQDAKLYYEYSPEKALAFFEADGYAKDGSGKLVKDGKQLVVNVYIGGDGEGNHPGYAMLTQAAADMKTLGAELQIQDVTFSVLQGAMNDGTADMFVMAWSAVNSCDKSTQFKTDGGQNRYHISDAEMDAMLSEILVTIDLDERRDVVSKMLDKAMDLAIELPLYQRKNILAYNEQNVDMSTIPENTTAFWNYTKELWKVAMK